MCRDTLLVSSPSNSLGPFSTEKKASASSLLWPANYFFHPWVHLPYLPGEEGGGGGGILPVACTERLHQKGMPFSGFRYMKG